MPSRCGGVGAEHHRRVPGGGRVEPGAAARRVAPTVSGRSGRAASTAMPLVCAARDPVGAVDAARRRPCRWPTTAVTGPMRRDHRHRLVGQRRRARRTSVLARRDRAAGWCRARRAAGRARPATGRRDADHGDHRGDADGDAERGQQRAQSAGCAARRRRPGPRRRGRSRAGASGVTVIVDDPPVAHGDPPAAGRAAISRSWVMTTTVVPAACSSRSSVHDARARRPSRGCRSARRRAAAPGRRPPRGRSRPAAARRRTARAAGGRGGGRGRPGPAPPPPGARRSPRGYARVEQAVGDVVQRRLPRRRGGTAGRRSRSGWPAAPTAAGRTAATRRGRRSRTVPAVGPVERADEVQHRGLARAGRADDRDQLAARRCVRVDAGAAR